MKYNERFKSFFFITFLLISTSVSAQLPDTDIFLTTLTTGKDGTIKFSTPENITRRKGYDNQPYFTPDSKSILYVSIRDEKQQSDIYSYDLATKKTVQLLSTPESEYSPCYTPGGKSLSFVRVNTDSTQKLYKAPVNDLRKAEMIKGTDSAGYFCWINDSVLAQFLIRDALQLQLLNIKSGQARLIASDIGRCIKLSHDGKWLYFILKNNAAEWTLMKMDIATGQLTRIIQTLHANEDYCLMKNGTILMGMGGKLYQFNPATDKDWKEIADFNGTVNGFYRIALSPSENKLALVAYIGEKP